MKSSYHPVACPVYCKGMPRAPIYSTIMIGGKNVSPIIRGNGLSPIAIASRHDNTQAREEQCLGSILAPGRRLQSPIFPRGDIIPFVRVRLSAPRSFGSAGRNSGTIRSQASTARPRLHVARRRWTLSVSSSQYWRWRRSTPSPSKTKPRSSRRALFSLLAGVFVACDFVGAN
jgi:hypothetical protein